MMSTAGSGISDMAKVCSTHPAAAQLPELSSLQSVDNVAFRLSDVHAVLSVAYGRNESP